MTRDWPDRRRTCLLYGRMTGFQLLLSVEWLAYEVSTCLLCLCFTAVCVLHIKPFFLPVDIQHNQCPWRFFNPVIEEIYIMIRSYAIKIPRILPRMHVSEQCNAHHVIILFLLVFSSFCFLVLFRFVFFVVVSSMIFSFQFSLHRMCMSCLSYLVWWHGIALSTAVLTAYQVRGNVVYLWRSFVTTWLVSLLRLKYRHGH